MFSLLDLGFELASRCYWKFISSFNGDLEHLYIPSCNLRLPFEAWIPKILPKRAFIIHVSLDGHLF